MISIVIPVYNHHKMTMDCLKSILKHTTDYEVILIDNGSDRPYDWHDIKIIDVKIITNKSNLGFPAAINQGIAAASGSTIVLLNNDCIVTPGWADKLLARLDTYSIVGPVTNYCAGIQQVSIPIYQSESELDEQATKWSGDNSGKSQEVNWIIGFCMTFPKSLFDSIGPFDESFWPCCGEEVDWCVRAKQSGHKIGIARDVYIHHFENQTFNELEKSGQVNYQNICKRNDMHLAKKWGKDVFKQEIQPQVTEGVKLNLGSGLRPQEGYINIDNRPEVNPDVIADILNLPYVDSSVDYIRAYDILEHIPLGKTIPVIEEIYRVLKPGGIFESFTPDAETGQGAFQDPTHLSFWVEQSWLYFSDPDCRKLYNTVANFNIESITRIESNYRVFHLHVIAKSRKEA